MGIERPALSLEQILFIRANSYLQIMVKLNIVVKTGLVQGVSSNRYCAQMKDRRIYHPYVHSSVLLARDSLVCNTKLLFRLFNTHHSIMTILCLTPL